MNTYKKTFQYRLKPTLEQLDLIEQAAGAVRFVYNWGTDLVRKASEKREPIPNYYVLARNLTFLKREEDKTWLKQAYNAAMQNGLKDLDLSVKAFFREIKKKNRVGLPGFRRKGFNDSMRFSSGVKHKQGKFYIPKIGLIGYYDSRPLQGVLRQATLCKIIDKWFINVVCEVSNSIPTPISKHNATTQVPKPSLETVPIDVLANLIPNAQQKVINQSCFISLGGGFLDKILMFDPIIVKKPKRIRAKKVNKAAKFIDPANQVLNATLNNDATHKTDNENQVVMAKETRDSLRALCRQYKDVFIATSANTATGFEPQAVSHEIRMPISLSKQKHANRLLVRRQKKLSRRVKNSVNREKARIGLEKQHLKMRRRRNDFLHKLSWKIVNAYTHITVKKYDLKKIMLSAYTPLAKILRDKSWDKFIQYVQYKSAWYGKTFVLT